MSIAVLCLFALSGQNQVSAFQKPTQKEVTPSIKESFNEKGIAGLDRLDQTELQKNCSDYAKKKMPTKIRAALEKQALASVKLPADGIFLGDWKEGEKIAQNGRGMQFSDDNKTVNGGNCYACHQINKAEISFGNIGPSLAQYGKLRGGPIKEVIEYTWRKIYNSHSVNVCSVMPRYGAAEILTEKQLKDVMALLLDPVSPVNQ
ncbi:MAG: sulfur oxidation c-type cytochrome SoxX [Undibacterium sp.]|nr:sulfur oxidation c-type cytochrome SoxX [Undibacterium sp.]